MKLEVGNRKMLYVDFALYTDGDTAIKRELIMLMIENLNELEESFHRSREIKNPVVFLEALHKVKPAIAMLNDPELNRVIQDLVASVDDGSIARFQQISAGITSSLLGEMHEIRINSVQ